MLHRARFDKERDAFLKEKKDYEVVRVSLVGKSSNEAIAAIHNIVMDRMDRKAEQDIQRLYSKDEAIQQLYQKKGGAE